MQKIITILLLCLNIVINAADGDLDTSFFGNGKVVTDVGSTSNEANAIALQPDGKIIAAGLSVVGGNNNFALARYNANGSLDISFGTNGIALTSFGGTNDLANAVVVQPNGKIIAAGRSNVTGNIDFALARYNPNGSLDTSFGNSGLVTTNFGGDTNIAWAIILQPDGKIIAAGQSNVGGNNNFALARYNPNGSLDASFGNSGLVTTNFSGTAQDEIFAAILQPDGKIVAVGASDAGGAGDNFALARYNANGSLDTSFGTGGLVTTNFSGEDEAFAVILQPDGKIIAAGRSNALGANDFALARYNANGSLDTSFGTGGLVITNLGGTDRALAVILQPDGKIVAIGEADPIGIIQFALARYNPNGSLDTSFGSNGFVFTSFENSVNDLANAAAIQADGKIVVAGSAEIAGNTDFALARYLIPSIEISLLAQNTRAKYFTVRLE
jgi:uncharacterized delta-60 repeat protein